MSNYFFEPPPVVSVPVSGSKQGYPVRRIFCVGRNYLAHAAEMGVSVDKRKQSPFYFTKSASALVLSGATIPYPPGTKNYHYEVELVLAIGKAGFEINEADADNHLFGYAVGLDMTRRDLQLKAREMNHPWDLAKDFEQSAVLSPIVPIANTGIVKSGKIELAVNGTTRQSSDIGMMIWSIPEIIAHLSQFYHLEPGDLIYTGTPEGVGAVVSGDTLSGSVENVSGIELKIA